MKIGQIENKPAAGVERTAAERKTDAAKAASTGASGASGASAQVALSPTATALTGGVEEASFDQAKVDRIAQAIRDGSYKINADAIADKLIANAQELLGKASG
jgi:negative regulator of flagellin synthesis FlgM